eukprot:sb/3463906/
MLLPSNIIKGIIVRLPSESKDELRAARMCECMKSCIHGMAKVILILINTISLLASLALIGFGVFVILRGEEYIPDAGVDVNAIAYALIVLGVILLFVSLFGFFGACTGKHGLLNFYLILLGVVVALLVAALIYGTVDVNAIAYALIVLGVILLFVSLFGFFGACTGKHGLLNFYLILLGVVVALLVAALIYGTAIICSCPINCSRPGFVMKSEVEEEVESYITEAFGTVKNATSANATVDQFIAVNTIQVAVKCCGITGPEYWDWGTEVPSSCCVNYTATDATALCDLSDAYTTACMESTEDLIQNALLATVVLLVVIIIFLVACMIFACCSKKGHPPQPTKREMVTWAVGRGMVPGFVMKSEVEEEVESYITEAFGTVKNATSANATVDQFIAVNTIQVAVKCCGITGPEYWDWGTQVPSSCCDTYDATDATALCDLSDAYTTACMESTEDLIQNALLATVVLLVVIIIFLVACMIFACCSKKVVTPAVTTGYTYGYKWLPLVTPLVTHQWLP